MEKIKTEKIKTDYGYLCITNRNGYFYAIKTVNQKKRQIYLGKSIPDIHTLNEVAKDIFSSDREWYKNHPPKSEKLKVKSQDTTLSLKDDLLRIVELSKALGEDRIAGELTKVISSYF
ncbi:hypothetical protein [Sphaerospermopsis sp. LEGE 08334]|uniref:hypothetical protein n=1 Tax=Sphaerospermopsis sp. LEGE 08334 TaxID=1828651 RepID=UPI0018803D64|nr:hypothetical protein [Sphaerospermopsis sp. LEGE 08334]MBE9059346.1 hypothetical protein [Sphaerospermopsis sp. LEGE 08334]